LHQNRGVLSKSKRNLYRELDDDELKRIEAAYQDAFEQPEFEFAGGPATQDA